MKLSTNLSAQELRESLGKWSPWRHLIEFSNGVRTDDFETMEPFARNPLAKMGLLGKEIPWEELRDGRALDIGFNCGHNALYLAQEHQMQVHGVDVAPRHLEVATFLAEVAGVSEKTSFELADAHTFVQTASFDLVVHFGTLYHLSDPVLALRTTAENLRPGGWLALETTSYLGPGTDTAKLIYGFKGDTTNWWAISDSALQNILRILGFESIKLLAQVKNEWLGPELSRTVHVARKAQG